MLCVNIWSFRGKSAAWGHASMQIDRTYISWWPEKPGQIPSHIHSNIYASHPFRNRSFKSDVAAEKQMPDHQIYIEGLDENKIKNWWQSFGLSRDDKIYQGPLLPWDTLKMNCSTVVSTALKKGGGDTYSSWGKSWNVVWKPSDVLAYALSIQKGLAKKDSKEDVLRNYKGY